MTELNMRTKSLHIAVVFKIQVCLFMSYCDLVKSHVLICHFIRWHLVPLPPYLLTIVKLRDFYENFYFGMRNPTVRYFMLRSFANM